jgi:type I restriction enzyme R subunit
MSGGHAESEWQTRRKRIDPILESEGWTVADFEPSKHLSDSQAYALTEYPTKNGPADYVLIVKRQVLGVIEAKKISLSAHGVLTQAERYGKGIENAPFDFNGCRVPFLYSTNGEEFWFHDVRFKLNTARKLSSFHSPQALQEMLSKDFEAATHILEATPNDHSRLQLDTEKQGEGEEGSEAESKKIKKGFGKESQEVTQRRFWEALRGL